jgi:ribosome maturation factor RimP
MGPTNGSDDSAPADRIRAVAAEVVAGTGYDVEDVAVIAAGRRSMIRVIIDSDHGVSLDAAADISRRLSGVLDAGADAVLGSQPYTLEVSSPGLNRPLTEERHFRRARGRLVVLTLESGGTVKGRVRRIQDGVLELLTDRTSAFVPLSDIRKGTIEVEFKMMPPAHAELLAGDGFVDPARAVDLDESGADDSDDDEDDDDEPDGGWADPDDDDDETEDHETEDLEPDDDDDDDEPDGGWPDPDESDADEPDSDESDEFGSTESAAPAPQEVPR